MPRMEGVRSLTNHVLNFAAEIVGLLVQVGLIVVGSRIIWGEDEDLDSLRLLVWCLAASAYLGSTILWLNIMVRLDQPDSPAFRTVVGHPITRFLSTVVTFGASALGLTVALELISQLGHQVHAPFSQGAAVWAMLLAWSMFNWGFARIYYSRYHRAPEPPLEFPRTPEPRIVDFVYLSFTNATTFAVSDVCVTSTRMRWTIVWHTTIAFFLNALIIVLTMNVITRGTLFMEL